MRQCNLPIENVKCSFMTRLKVLFHCKGTVELQMDHFTRDIDNELKSSNPISTDGIVTLYLMMDTEFMTHLIRRNSGFRGTTSIVAISRDPFHPLYHKVKRAFDFAQERRKLAGFSLDPWPMVFDVSGSRDCRRLVWEPVVREIKEAWKLYRRFMREGYRPYSVDEQGNALVPVNTFDPHAGELMFQEIQDGTD